MEHDRITEGRDRVLKRLKRIEGQLGGITAMIEQNRSCEDVLTQLSAVNAAVTAVAREVLFEHIEHCVADGVRSGDETAAVDNLRSAVTRFSKLK